jgi:hypothetical protein
MEPLHPTDPEPRVGLAVRPDVLVTALAARVDAGAATAAVEALRLAAADLERALAAVAPRAALVARRLRLDADADKAGRATAGEVSLDAAVEVPLEPEQGYWARAALAAAVAEALAAFARDAGRRKPAIRLAWRSPVARVREPEAHRGELSLRWQAAVRALGLTDAPHAARLAVPTEIRETPISLDEVRLALVAPAPPARAGG